MQRRAAEDTGRKAMWYEERQLFTSFKLIYDYRKILFAIIKDGLKTRYAGSMLGLFWLILYPLLFLGVYAVIYIFIFKVRLQILNPYEYVLLIFCGLIPFLSFAEALGTGTQSVVGNSQIIKNTLFPIDLMPVRDVFISQAVQVVGLIMLFIISFVLHKLGPMSVFVLLVWFFQIMFTIGLIWIFSSVNVFMRDLGYIVAIINLILMMISPIAYTEDMVPQALRMFLRFNPLYYLIMLYQKLILFNELDLRKLVVFGAVAVITYVAGYHIFSKLKLLFADQV
jgi:lipopolysaccharide transport system permease protein